VPSTRRADDAGGRQVGDTSVPSGRSVRHSMSRTARQHSQACWRLTAAARRASECVCRASRRASGPASARPPDLTCPPYPQPAVIPRCSSWTSQATRTWTTSVTQQQPFSKGSCAVILTGAGDPRRDHRVCRGSPRTKGTAALVQASAAREQAIHSARNPWPQRARRPGVSG